MNCQSVISQLGFSCRDLGGDTLRVWSPFTYGRDGDVIGFYVEKTSNGYIVTDGCESFMHASALGINLTDSKVNAVRKASGYGASISDGGEISAFVSEEEIGRGMATVLNASLAVAHLEMQWEPRFRAESFVKSVEMVLESKLAGKVLRKLTVTGASGHQFELPLAVKSGNSLIYIQPVSATDDNNVDWRNIYASWGRMTDLKNANIEGAKRLIVLEEAANDSDMKRAISLLADSASVVNYSKLSAWADQRRA